MHWGLLGSSTSSSTLERLEKRGKERKKGTLLLSTEGFRRRNTETVGWVSGRGSLSPSD